MNFKKVSYDEEKDGEPDIESVFRDFPECVLELFNEKVQELKNHFVYSVNMCESPIEQLMAICLNDMQDQWIYNRYMLGIDIINICNQEKIKIQNKEVRVDFLISVMDRESERRCGFIVECDGHEFHHKTKQQVQKDYERTILLQTEGYVVIRFTGSEVFKSPEDCRYKIEKIIVSYFRPGR